MASDIVIQAEGLGKKYVIGHEAQPQRYVALRDVLARTAHNTWRTTLDLLYGRAIVAGDTIEEFWALKDVNFEIMRGEVVGIIGRNGAGKTTLLKILSRITDPTEGRVMVEGRAASLLEVGTGFHPELTGRENIYLNGTILGMTRAEIRRKFDEIVAFAEVERFLDTPVKRYSSGMYVRLAFSVAAHLEPEILVIDEVLAVGDVEFQKKCLGKMGEVAEQQGRTVLFVSHNMAAVQTLCQRCLVIVEGRREFLGITTEAISRYLNASGRSSVFRKEASGTGRPKLIAASAESLAKKGNQTELTLNLSISSDQKINANIDVRVRDNRGAPIAFATAGVTMSSSPVPLSPGVSEIAMRIDVSCLAVGNYTLSVDISRPWVEYYDRNEDCLEFSVEAEHWPGLLHPLRQDWQFGSVFLPSTWSNALQQLRSVDELAPDRQSD
jgi:lipopolysaccharide transport system ATP-binding protein